MSLFAIASMALAALGIHGVVGHVLAMRSRELAVRAALGEGPTGLVASALRDAPRICLAGITIGLAFAYLAGRVAAGWLVDVRA